MDNAHGHGPILIVDDNPASLRLARRLLELDDYEVRTAIDAEDALRVLETFQPRLILMDVQLPQVDGIELTRRLRADPAFAGVRIVALTAHAAPEDRERVREAGCDGYVEKPMDARSLPEVVAEFLAPPSTTA